MLKYRNIKCKTVLSSSLELSSMSSISSSFGDLPSHKKTGVWWHNYPYNLYTQHLTPFAVLLLQYFSKYCMGLEHLPLFYHFKQTWWHHRSYSDHDCFSIKSEQILVCCFLLLPCGVIWNLFSILVSEEILFLLGDL